MSSQWVDQDAASIRLISATQGTGDGSAPLTFGLEFQLKDGWKIYWRSPGDAGFPPKPDWSTSSNVADVTMRWPAPVRFSILGFETLGYKKEVVFPLDVTPARTGEAITLSGSIDYLICSDICIPDTVQVSLNVPPGEPVASKQAHLINKYAVRVPGDGKAHGLRIASLALDTTQPKPTIQVVVSSAEGLAFASPDIFMEGPADLGFSPPSVRIEPDGLRAILDVELINSENVDADLSAATFTATLVDGKRSIEGTLTPNAGTSLQPVGQQVATVSLISILALAFLGGLILNLMPCVLPVLSIKLLGVVSHGGSDARAVRRSFLASAAGIVTSFLILAGALAALKSAGAAIGWGIQFQQPWFLIAMALIITVFACNLWGWFEVRLPSSMDSTLAHVGHGHGVLNHFLTGMLATLLATPCSAPFLGTAVGFALARGTSEIMIIFAVLGIGLASPYILVAAAPRLATRLPKPGGWMLVLRRVLGVALAGTTGWLLWVLYVQLGSTPAVVIGIILSALIAALYIRHRVNSLRSIPALGLVAALGIAALLVPYGIDSTAQTKASADSKALDGLWQPFERERIAQLVEQGQVVFVDVTAEWCISCLVNKNFVLAADPVFMRLNVENTVVMQADWTLPDPRITAYLTSFERYGIPFNAVYGPGAPQGIVLPELLRSDAVLRALEKAAGNS